MIQTQVTTLSPFQILDPIITAPPGTDPLTYVESGLTSLPIGQRQVVVTFQKPKVSAYVFEEVEIVNTLDNPVLVLPFDIIAQPLTGFTIVLSATPDTGNYSLQWRVGVPPS